MSISYRKNTILCGEIDYFCLICEEALYYESDVECHIHLENHKKLLKNITYISTFKDDFIIKIKNHYYCELCNAVMPTLIKTVLHIKDEKHIHYKQHPKTNNNHQTAPVRRNAGSVTISDITLTEKEWNGIINNQCLLCDLELKNIEEHMKSQSHLINLIQAKTEKSLEFYRKIGNDIFFCFTCKEPVFLSEIDVHWVSKEHVHNQKLTAAEQVNNGASCSSSTSESFSTQFKKNMRKMFDPPKNITNESAIAKKLQDFQMENINIDFERSKATCKQCNFTPAFTVKAIQDHISMHKHAEIQLQSEYSENKETPQHTTQKSTKPKTVSEKATENKNKKPDYETKTLKQYVKSLTFFKEIDAFWINKTLALERHSFKMICENNAQYNNMKCYLCNDIFPSKYVKEHWKLRLHKEKLLQTKVITTLNNEFVREFHSNEFRCSLFHCGFCNEVTLSFAAMETHLNTDDHQKNKGNQFMMTTMIKDMEMVADLVCYKLMQSF